MFRQDSYQQYFVGSKMYPNNSNNDDAEEEGGGSSKKMRNITFDRNAFDVVHFLCFVIIYYRRYHKLVLLTRFHIRITVS